MHDLDPVRRKLSVRSGRYQPIGVRLAFPSSKSVPLSLGAAAVKSLYHSAAAACKPLARATRYVTIPPNV